MIASMRVFQREYYTYYNPLQPTFPPVTRAEQDKKSIMGQYYRNMLTRPFWKRYVLSVCFPVASQGSARRGCARCARVLTWRFVVPRRCGRPVLPCVIRPPATARSAQHQLSYKSADAGRATLVSRSSYTHTHTHILQTAP